MMMVKKNIINITRLTQIEDPIMSCMWFKIKTQDSTKVFSAWYRQWNLPADIRHLHDDSVDDEVPRLENFQRQTQLP